MELPTLSVVFDGTVFTIVPPVRATNEKFQTRKPLIPCYVLLTFAKE